LYPGFGITSEHEEAERHRNTSNNSMLSANSKIQRKSK